LQDLHPHSIPAYRFWAEYLKNGITEAGHTWVEVPGVDWAEGITGLSKTDQAKWRDLTWSRTVEFLLKEQTQGRVIDIFLSYLYPVQVEPTVIGEIRRLGIPCVNFFCDNVREFARIPSEYEPFDLHWVPEFEALAMYKSRGMSYLHAPMPCWVSSKWRTIPTAENNLPTFVGSADILRRALLGHALQLGAGFVVCGPGWGGDSIAEPKRSRSFKTVLSNQWEMIRLQGSKVWLRYLEQRFHPLSYPAVPPAQVRPAAFGEDYVRATRDALVTIGVNRVPTLRASNRDPITYSRLRDIEAPMLGACYLTEWTAGLGELYELGKEIETYRKAEELADKLKALQKDPERRCELRKLGQRRALESHSVPATLKRMMEHLGLHS
jgi:hypothetical protein